MNILAIDQGTTSSRSLLVDRQGTAGALGQYPLAACYPRPGWVEQDADALWESQCRAIRATLRQGNIARGDVAAVGIANQRETIVVWNRATGKPFAPVVVWQCRRTSDVCASLQGTPLNREVREKTGLLLDAYFSATKLAWILDHIPQARMYAEAGDLLCGTVESFLIWKLTGGKVHVTDISNAARTLLFNIHTLRWDSDLCRAFDIPMGMLPAVVPSSQVYGEVADGLPGLEPLAGVPISGAAGDQAAALFGQACFRPGQMKNTYGTGCFWLLNVGDAPVQSRNGLLCSPAWRIGGRTTYALEGSMFNAGSVIQWLRDELGLIGSAPECDEWAAKVSDTGGVACVPAFTGLGAPHWDMYARGALLGLTRGTGKAHICRAVLESIAFQMDEMLTAMEKDTGLCPDELRVDGGASRSDILLQMSADLLNVTVNRPLCVESTALGASFLAGLAVGFWKDTEELSALRRTDTLFIPHMQEKERRARRKLWAKAVERAKHWEEPSGLRP